MIKKISRLLSLVLIATLFSCSSDSDSSDNPTPTVSAPITASIDDQPWASMTDGATTSLQIVDMGVAPDETIIQIIGTKMDNSTIILEFPINNLVVGSYTFNDHTNATLIYNSPEGGYHTSYRDGGSLNLTISEVNLSEGTISGTFSGKVLDFEGNSLTITNGTINNVSILKNYFYCNGTMGLSRNGGTAFTMDADQRDAKYLMITENWLNETLSLYGYNSTLTNDAGFYNLTLPQNTTVGTYDLTSDEGFNAIIGTSENQNEFNVTSGSVTISSHNGNNVVGTFNFTVSNGTENVTVTNGSFNITHN